MKELQELGRTVSSIMHRVYKPEAIDEQIQKVNETLARMARDISGCRSDQLTNEDLDEKPIVRLYWTTLAELTAKMFMYAAQGQSYYKEADR